MSSFINGILTPDVLAQRFKLGQEWERNNPYQYDYSSSNEMGSLKKRSANPQVDPATGLEEGSLQKRALDLNMGSMSDYLFPNMAQLAPFAGNNESTIMTGKTAQNVGARSKVLTDTVNMFMIAQDETTVWGKIAPIEHLDIEDPSICVWITHTYLPTFAQKMPPMGVPTLVRSIRSGGRVALARYSIAAAMAEESFKYKNGLTHWLNTLNQMAGAMISATQLAVARIIANGENEYLKRLNMSGLLTPQTIDDEFNYLAYTFGKLQLPGPTDFTALYDKMQTRYQMRNNDPTSDRFIILSEGTYNNMVHNNPETIVWTTLGNEGTQLLKRQGTLGEVNHLGINLFVLRSFNVEGTSEQPTQKYIEVGEYARMYNAPYMYKEYKSNNRNIQVFLEQRGWTEFSLLDAIKNCVKWEGNDAPVPMQNGAFYRHAFGDLNGNLAKKFGATWWWEAFEASSLQLLDARFVECKNEDITYRNLTKYVQENIPIPLNFMFAWPHIRMMADDAILATPRTYCRMIKPNIVSVANNALSRVHEITAEFEAGCAILQPQNLISARAVRPCVYMGGLENNPIVPDNGYNPVRWEYSGDYVAIVLPPTFDRTPTNLCLAGSIHGCLTQRFREATDASGHDPNDYDGSVYYDTWYGFTTPKVSAHVPGVRLSYNTDPETDSSDWSSNCVCRPMIQRQWDAVSGSYKFIDWGDGYFKQGMTYSGCHATRWGGSYAKKYGELSLTTI